MAIFERSDTNQDAVSLFTPQSFLGRGRGRMRLGGVGRRMRISGMGDVLDDFLGIDAGGAPVYETAPGYDWGGMLGKAGDIATQLYAIKTQGELQQLNVQRASQGLAPIPASALAPQVNVGMAPDTQKTLLMLGLGVAVILGGAYAFGVIGKRGRRR